MGLLDRLFGRRRPGAPPGYAQGYDGYQAPPPPPQGPPGRPAPPTGASGDERAVERYRYLLRTAPPDAIEQAHAEAFAQLTPQQRQEVLTQLAATVPAAERPRADDPRTLARAATRAEVRRPGTLERAFGSRGGYGGPGGGPGFGSVVGASLLGTVGGLVVGTAIADAVFGGDEAAYAQGYEDAQGGGDAGDHGGEYGEAAGGDFGAGDFGAGDFGGDFGGSF